MLVGGALLLKDAADRVPNAFTFTDVTDVEPVTVQTSAPVTISGLGASAIIGVSGGEYSINGGAYTSASGSVLNGDQVRARHTASASGFTAVNTTVTVGGVSDTFTSTTGILPATFVGASTATSTTQVAVPLPSGWQVGDLAILFVTDSGTNPNVQTAGWSAFDTYSWTGGSGQTWVYSRVLQSGDANPVIGYSFSSSPDGTMLVYRNASTATRVSRTTSTATATTLVLTGFTKNASCRRVVSHAADRDLSAPTLPSGFTSRVNASLNMRHAAADVSPYGYTNGASATWSGFGNTLRQAGFLIELT